jgi:hypothetical protein
MFCQKQQQIVVKTVNHLIIKVIYDNASDEIFATQFIGFDTVKQIFSKKFEKNTQSKTLEGHSFLYMELKIKFQRDLQNKVL